MQFFKSFIISAISTILLSLIIFIATISLMTGKFPPDLQKLKMTFQNAQRALKTSQKIMANTNWEELDRQFEGGLPTTRMTSPHLAAGNPERRINELEFQNLKLQNRVAQLEIQVKNLKEYFDKTPTK